MPVAAPTPCTKAGCGKLNCIEHRDAAKRERQARIDAQRGSSSKRGYTSRWQKARATFLREHPLCMCEQCDEGKIRLRIATHVDHRIPHRGDQRLFWDTSNWQSMHADCHNAKTAREDGGFGNPGRGGRFPGADNG